jgi:integral membrane protein
VSTLRKLTWVEGISFLLLLGVAMPLKYAAGRPGAVKVFGWIHGALFALLCVVLALEARRRRWPLKWALLVFVAALIPFGPFLFDRRIADYESRDA